MTKRKPKDPDRSADLPVNRMERILHRLKNLKFFDPVDIGGWEHRRARYHEPGNYDYIDKQWSKIIPGEQWGGDDVTSFLRTSVHVPESHRGEDGAVQIDLDGGEALLSINGRAWQGLDWNRSLVPLFPLAEKNPHLSLEIEAYVINYPYDARRKDERSFHLLRTTRFLRINRELEGFLNDASMMVDFYRALWENDEDLELEAFLLNRLESVFSLLGPPTLVEKTCLKEQERIEDAHALLRSSVLESPYFRNPGEIAICAHSHLDILYLWPLKETLRKNSRTVSNALSLMREFKDYRFAWSQPWLYEQLKASYPELYKEVKERIKEGRWEVVGAMYVEADGNIPGAESNVRQLLFGRQFFLQEFGLEVKGCWLPDVFGLMYTMPQIMKKSGIDSFSTMKLNIWNDTNDFPYDTFRWKGPDGSEVLVHAPPTHYSQNLTLCNLRKHWRNFRDRYRLGSSLFVYGPADGGGGPTREMAAMSCSISDSGGAPGLPETRISRVDAFFEEVSSDNRELPVWDDELYLEAHRGTYTTRGALKKVNRNLEGLYRNAEVCGSLSRIFGAAPFQRELNQGWRLLLLNHFHDTITGTHVPEAHEQIHAAYEEAGRIGTEVLYRAIEWIGDRLGLPDFYGTAYVVFNSLSWPREALIPFAFTPNDKDPGSFIARDLRGRRLDCQFFDGQWWVRVPEIPSAGWTTVFIEHETVETAGAAEEADESWCRFTGDEGKIETPFYRLSWDSSGNLVSIFDRIAGRELVSGPANCMQIFDDDPGEKYSAWDIPYHVGEHSVPVLPAGSWQCESTGPLFAVFTMRWEVLNSSIEQKMVLHREDRLIEFKTKVLWNDSCKLLKVAFPLALQAGRATTHLPFGAINRSTHRNTSWEQAKYETVMHYWADISRTDFGVSILNDCKYGCDIYDSTIRLSLVRSPVRPDGKSDLGEHRFSYALYPHEKSWEHGGTCRRGYEYNIPVVSAPVPEEGSGKKVLEAEYSLLEIDRPNLIMETLKEAESGDGFILRTWEATGGEARGRIVLNMPVREVVETDLIERPLPAGPSGKPGNEMQKLIYGPFEIKTHHLRL
jgi:alpha-mannosidase